MSKRIGVIVARFQVAKLHAGHIHLIDSVYKKSDEVVIILGDSPNRDLRNPLSFGVRMGMIYQHYPTCLVFKINDHPINSVWSENLDFLITTVANGADVTLYGSRDSFQPCYSGKYPYEQIPELEGFSGTDMRNEITNKAFDKMDDNFRAGIIYGLNQLIRVQ
jgi:bifunctional NMN adenylyltransferase/nudix hydrolase